MQPIGWRLKKKTIRPKRKRIEKEDSSTKFNQSEKKLKNEGVTIEKFVTKNPMSVGKDGRNIIMKKIDGKLKRE